MVDLGAADAVGAVYEFLRGPAAAEVEAALGGPAHVHVTGVLEPGWPHIILSTGPGGDMRDLLWDSEQEVMVEVYSSPAGVPGEADLWAACMRIVQLVRSMPERQVEPGAPVVARVKPSGAMAYQTLPTGHGKWTLGLLVVIHP